VRVVERGDHARLALESRARVGVAGNVRRQQLDGDAAIEPRVARPVDVAHATRADRCDDLVRPKPSARFEVHCVIRTPILRAIQSPSSAGRVGL
jgi:hypothetical protein